MAYHRVCEIKKNLVFLISCVVSNSVFAVSDVDFTPEISVIGTIAPYEMSSLFPINLPNKNAYRYAYRPWFENGKWNGDLISYRVDANGKLVTRVSLSLPKDMNGTPYYLSATPEDTWSASAEFSAASWDNKGKPTNYWDKKRVIFTRLNGNQIPFRKDLLPAVMVKAADDDDKPVNILSDDAVNYLRGNRSKEEPLGGFPRRLSLLGAIIRGNPVFVSSSERESFHDEDYLNYTKRPNNLVVVGSNDGMVHVFNALNGRELYAYVPSMVIGKIGYRTIGQYPLLVDGQLVVSDAKVLGKWRTIFSGGLGGGGKGIFVVELTESAEENGKNILWEIRSPDPVLNNSSDGDPDVGMIFGQPSIVKYNDGNFYTVFGNGYNSDSGKAVLYHLNMTNGAITKTEVAAENNGLSTPALIDVNYDGMADYAYAGDIRGNMWKFSLDVNPDSGALNVTKNLVFSGDAKQPIIEKPDLVLHPEGGLMIYAATGRLFEKSDANNTDDQFVFAFWDDFFRESNGNFPIDLNDLLKQEFLVENNNYSVLSSLEPVWKTSANTKHHKGWYLKLINGKRVLHSPQVRGGRLRMPLVKPELNGKGEVKIISNVDCEINYLTGGNPNLPIFDVNQDNKLDHKDKVGDVFPSCKEREPIGGVRSVTLIVNQNNREDVGYTNHYALGEPSTEPTCTDDCSGDPGFAKGHVDVDTNTTHGTETEEHVHEYDDATGLTYFDYLKLDSPDPVDLNADGVISKDESDGAAAVSKLHSVYESNLPTDGTRMTTQFVMIVANADLSPGALLVLGNRCVISAVEYQRAIQIALQNGKDKFDGDASIRKDEMSCNGKSIYFTLAEIDGLPFRTVFSGDVLTNGGIIPSETGCIRPFSDREGRPRNGAYVIQLIRRDAVDNSIKYASNLRKISPNDLRDFIHIDYGTKDDYVYLNDRKKGAVYGGLYFNGANKNDMLYESLLFWHWDQGGCYNEGSYSNFSLAVNAAGNYQKNTGVVSAAVTKQYINSMRTLFAKAQNAMDKDFKTDENYSFEDYFKLAKDTKCTLGEQTKVCSEKDAEKGKCTAGESVSTKVSTQEEFDACNAVKALVNDAEYKFIADHQFSAEAFLKSVVSSEGSGGGASVWGSSPPKAYGEEAQLLKTHKPLSKRLYQSEILDGNSR